MNRYLYPTFNRPAYTPKPGDVFYYKILFSETIIKIILIKKVDGKWIFSNPEHGYFYHLCIVSKENISGQLSEKFLLEECFQ